MRRMLVLLALIAAVALLLSGCDSIERAMHPGQTQIAGVWVDQSKVDAYDFKGAQATLHGDTYCKNCGKFSAGKVRICPYCGQYI